MRAPPRWAVLVSVPRVMSAMWANDGARTACFYNHPPRVVLGRPTKQKPRAASPAKPPPGKRPARISGLPKPLSDGESEWEDAREQDAQERRKKRREGVASSCARGGIWGCCNIVAVGSHRPSARRIHRATFSRRCYTLELPKEQRMLINVERVILGPCSGSRKFGFVCCCGF